MSTRAILCVDDEEMVLRSLKRELNADLGTTYLIETAESGPEALSVFAELVEEAYEVPVVICDYIMPEMRGDELLRQLHLHAPDTLKIMLTGQANIDAITNAINLANLYRYIAKPWEKTDLVLTVREAVDKYFQNKKLAQQHQSLQELYRQAQQEITERRKVEEKLRKSEASMRAIVEAAADGIITFDIQGDIEAFNPAAEQIFGYTAAEIRGRNINLLIAASPHAEYDRHFIQGQDSSQKKVICLGHEVQGIRKDGRLFPLDLTVSEISVNAQQKFTGIVRDITGRKRAERERLQLSALQRELSIARDIQQSLLPPPSPDWPDVNVLCYNEPAREVSGDFYSYHSFQREGQRHRALAIGDVSGKGVSAALLMATTLSLFDAAFALDLTPAARMAYLDQIILPYTKPRGQNCALCYMECNSTMLDATAFHDSKVAFPLWVANAGCIPPYIKRRDGSVEILDIGGIPLGMGLGAKIGYEELRVDLWAGDMVVLMSDGVVEANLSTHNMFGFERLEATIASAPTTHPQAMLDHIIQAVRQFVGNAAPHDDITIIILQA